MATKETEEKYCTEKYDEENIHLLDGQYDIARTESSPTGVTIT